MNSVISSIESSLEKPAACRWPPPPEARAIFDTSISSADARRLIRRAGPIAAWWLADQRGHVGSLDGAQVVDDALRVGLRGADLGEVVAEQVRDHEPSALVDLGPLERAGEQLHLRELHALVDVLEDLVHVGARLHELCGEAQGLGGRVRVLEPARVGDERDVQGLRDVRRQLDAELGQEVADDLAGRRRVRDDEVDRAEARVVVVVVDVDDERRAVQDLWIGPEPALVRAIEREQDPVGGVLRNGATQVSEGHPRVFARQRRLACQVHDGVLAQRVEAELGREQRAERVAVRVLVRRDEKTVVRPDRIDYGCEVSCRLGRAHRLAGTFSCLARQWGR